MSMTLFPQPRVAEPGDNWAMTQSTHTFAHYPLDPDLVARYGKKNYMGMYLDSVGELTHAD